MSGSNSIRWSNSSIRVSSMISLFCASGPTMGKNSSSRTCSSVFYSTWYLVPVYSQYSPTDQINGLIPGVGVYQWNLITLYLARQAHLIELDLHFLPII